MRMHVEVNSDPELGLVSKSESDQLFMRRLIHSNIVSNEQIFFCS